ncbi:tRNA lysidine(34) synthetase TilS [Desulfuribacillus alkaliarsenatis]|uniref:tRNA(Ile)-lysidine synthase n=1 Tax=Desulfuribacillus alkaliarsenatis TaxID=766136 RepID=A0A1E5FYX4_9FIRM|nr:tRNA lysidine(34) synthetase TilS [Desulfuribacillus alkaliarsenatis]OEF95774.1 tRNA lysidine(34) synthetase TilS [Desulfuribacillus alkaliarsenatis]
MEQNLLSTIRNNILELKDKTLIVGVSGGPDSIALLDCLARLRTELNLTCIVAHLEHGFRGQVSKDDAAYVQRFAEERELIFRMKAVNMPKIVQEEHGSAQELAREQRYQWFTELSEEYKTPYIVLGHHQDDQIETVLMRIIRGTSPAGLAGIEGRTKRDRIIIIRPLLNIEKQQLEEYCVSAGITPRLDASNADNHYLRNKIRNCLLPQLTKEYNDNTKQALLNLSDLAREDDLYFQKIAEKEVKNVLVNVIANEQYHLNRYKMVNMHIALQRRVLLLILYYLKKETRFQKKHIDSIIAWITAKESGGLMQLPAGILVSREAESIIIYKEREELTPLKMQKLNLGKNLLSNGSIIELAVSICESGNRYKNTVNTVYFDKNELPAGSLFCRSRKDGDRMTIFGMNGSKKVKDILIDAKVPSYEREQIPVVVSEDEILWLAGVRRSNVAPVTSKTKEVVMIQYIDN